MKLRELINLTSAKSGMSKSDVRRVLCAVALVVRLCVAARRDVWLFGLGQIVTRDLPARRSRNPRENVEIMAPATVVVGLRPSVSLVDAANGRLPAEA